MSDELDVQPNNDFLSQDCFLTKRLAIFQCSVNIFLKLLADLMMKYSERLSNNDSRFDPHADHKGKMIVQEKILTIIREEILLSFVSMIIVSPRPAPGMILLRSKVFCRTPTKAQFTYFHISLWLLFS